MCGIPTDGDENPLTLSGVERNPSVSVPGHSDSTQEQSVSGSATTNSLLEKDI